jgi:death-on-curing protein
MAEDAQESLSAELDRLLNTIASEFVSRPDESEALQNNVRLLAYAATCFNVRAIQTYGGRLGAIRAPGLVEQVVGAAFQTFAGFDPHPGPFDKAAMLLRGITQGHPFNDGNKRTGYLTASYFLALVGVEPPPAVSVPDAVALCLRISAGEIRDVTEIAQELRRLWECADNP